MWGPGPFVVDGDQRKTPVAKSALLPAHLTTNEPLKTGCWLINIGLNEVRRGDLDGLICMRHILMLMR
jgi:hypothetical protein